MNTKITQNEFLIFERMAQERHEYFNGNFRKMESGSYYHNIIEDNIRGKIGIFLKGSGCRSLGSNLRVHSPKNTLYTYSDALIICGEPKFADDQFDTLLNPSVLIEILSPSTANYDKGTKFELYRDIESLQEYMLISSTKMHVELYQKNTDASWTLNEFKQAAHEFEIRTIEMRMHLGAIYDGVVFK